MSEPTPEPSLTAILDAINALAVKVDGVEAKVDGVSAEQQILSGKLDQLAQDVMAVKVDTGFLDRHIADFQAWARSHQDNPNAHRPAA